MNNEVNKDSNQSPSAEIQGIIEQLKDAYSGEPWFGRSLKSLLSEVDEAAALQKLNGQHSMLELLWHIINWREFTISRLNKNNEQAMRYFDENDWRELDHTDKSLWQKGLKRLDETQKELVAALEQVTDDLDKIVAERKYSLRKLLHGVIQHDIYHLGQIAFIKKAVSP